MSSPSNIYLHNQDVIVFSTIELSRNIMNIPFPSTMTDKHRASVVLLVESILKKHSPSFKKYNPQSASTDIITHLYCNFALDYLLLKPSQTITVFYSDESNISITLNAKNHIHIKGVSDGLDLLALQKSITKIDNFLCDNINIAYNDKFGHLTSCPSNAGCGMKISILSTVPALAISRALPPIIKSMITQNIAFSGYYTNISNKGTFLLLRNKTSANQSVDDIMQSMSTLAYEIIIKERLARDKLINKNPVALQDKILRSLGILKYAKQSSAVEGDTLLSHMYLGQYYSMFKNIDCYAIKNTLLKTRTLYYSLLHDKVPIPNNVNELRAQDFNEVFKEVTLTH